MLNYTQLSVTEERIRYSALKVLWHAGQKTRALNELSSFVKALATASAHPEDLERRAGDCAMTTQAISRVWKRLSR